MARGRSTDHFLHSASDKRVLYEPGADNYAREIANYMPEAIETVEKAHYLPFKDAVEVYICASDESYYRLTGHKAPATVTHKLFISPALFQEKRDIHRYLSHELSHLHLLQRIGAMRLMELPSWFKEGLAEYACDGATGFQITDHEAIRSIKTGHHFVPDEGRNVLATFLSPRYGSYWDLDAPMFYRQCMLFVRFMHTTDEVAFHKSLVEFQQGVQFKDAFVKAYGKKLSSLWEKYLQEIKTSG